MSADGEIIERIRRVSLEKNDLDIEREKQEVIDWSRKCGHRLEEYYTLIDKLLKKGNINKLQILFNQEEFQKDYFKDTRIALMSIILKIYELEKIEGAANYILQPNAGMRQTENYFLKTKFMVWRMEFQAGDEETQAFIAYIKEQKVSLQCLKYILHVSSFDKANTSFRLAMAFKAAGMSGMAFGMLNYTLELCPNEELVLCEMADICFDNRRFSAASECIGLIKEPTRLLASYREKWGI